MTKFALALGIAVGATLNAQAHFIFLELPSNEATTAHMRLAEEPLEASDADLQEKCAPMTVKTVNGTPVEFAPGESAMTATVSEETSALLGSLDYGIMDRQGVYLLVYHAKAVRNLENAGQTNGLPVEVLTEVKEGNLIVTVLSQGKPAAGAELVVNLPTAEEQAKATTDAEGKATFPIEPGGWVGIRAKVQETKSGTHGDKPYEEVRHYSTLTFPYLAE